jgi:predicted PhzF superfamily epimerase YddE/YHI9
MLGVAVTAPGLDGADFVSRFFAPWVGVPEDPVTGLAHTALAPYWARLLARTRLQARQLSAREGDVGRRDARRPGRAVRARDHGRARHDGRPPSSNPPAADLGGR